MILKGFILDVDGTLIDSNTAHAHAFSETLREQHFNISSEKVFD